METPAAAPMGLACQSLLVRDDGGGVRHPFQYGGAGPTSALRVETSDFWGGIEGRSCDVAEGLDGLRMWLGGSRRWLAVILLSLVYGAITFHRTNVLASI